MQWSRKHGGAHLLLVAGVMTSKYKSSSDVDTTSVEPRFLHRMDVTLVGSCGGYVLQYCVI